MTNSALVEASNGLFLAQAGWLIAPPWRELLGPGLKATASTSEGVAWLAHESGLYRLRDGQLAAVAARFGIRSIPTILFFKDGALVDTVVGAVPRPALERKIQAHL